MMMEKKMQNIELNLKWNVTRIDYKSLNFFLNLSTCWWSLAVINKYKEPPWLTLNHAPLRLQKVLSRRGKYLQSVNKLCFQEGEPAWPDVITIAVFFSPQLYMEISITIFGKNRKFHNYLWKFRIHFAEIPSKQIKTIINLHLKT